MQKQRSRISLLLFCAYSGNSEVSPSPSSGARASRLLAKPVASRSPAAAAEPLGRAACGCTGAILVSCIAPYCKGLLGFQPQLVGVVWHSDTLVDKPSPWLQVPAQKALSRLHRCKRDRSGQLGGRIFPRLLFILTHVTYCLCS